MPGKLPLLHQTGQLTDGALVTRYRLAGQYLEAGAHPPQWPLEVLYHRLLMMTGYYPPDV